MIRAGTIRASLSWLAVFLPPMAIWWTQDARTESAQTIPSVFLQQPESLRMMQDGRWSCWIRSDQDQRYTVVLQGASTPLRHAPARIVVSMDDRLISNVYFPPRTTEITLPLWVQNGSHLLTLAYVNDDNLFPQDRNVLITKVEVSPYAPSSTSAPFERAGELVSASQMPLGTRDVSDGDARILFPGGSLSGWWVTQRSEYVDFDVELQGAAERSGKLALHSNGRPCAAIPSSDEDHVSFRCPWTPEQQLISLSLSASARSPVTVRTIQSIPAAPSDAPPWPLHLSPVTDGHVSTGQREGNSWRMLENGVWHVPIRSFMERSASLILTARAESPGSEGAHVVVLLGDAQLAAFSVGTDSRSFLTDVRLPQGVSEVWIAFTNDAQLEDHDRNLVIDSLEVR